MTDPRPWLTLLRAPVSASQAHALLERHGAPARLLTAGAAALRRDGLDEKAVDALLAPDAETLASDLEWLDRPAHHLVTCLDEAYPPLLRETPGAPLALFVVGDPGVLALPQLAIVGSRNPTAAGADNAAAFADHFARVGLTVTSGLAAGIDTAAHRGALHGGGRTVAVTGCGPDRIYPAANAELAHAIAGAGAIVTEFPPGTPPHPYNFPRRNRIIAGLSLGTLVVEAARRSGALITAHRAIEYGREVFAIPGSIHNALARGCHRLIREGAKLVESAGDVLEELAPVYRASQDAGTTVESAEAPAETLADEYETLLETVGYEQTSVDQIVERSGLTADAVSSMLLILELRGYVQTAPGGGYMRTGKEARTQ